MGIFKGIRVCGLISVSRMVEDLWLEVPSDFWAGGSPVSHVTLHVPSRPRSVIWRGFAGVIVKNVLRETSGRVRGRHSGANYSCVLGYGFSCFLSARGRVLMVLDRAEETSGKPST